MAGPLLAGGYFDKPEETAAAFRDGWMHTGDVAREDEDGFWHIVDRTKDMIVTGASTSSRARSRTLSPPTPQSPRWPSSARPTRSGARP